MGHAIGNRAERVIIGVSGDAVAGTFVRKGKLFKLEPRADGSHVLSEVGTGDPAPEADPIPVTAPDTGPVTETDPASSGGLTLGAETAADAGQQIIDVMVAYTPKVEQIYGAAGAEALIIQAVAETNQAYANSGINPRLNLVHSVRTNYTESGDINTDLSRLRATSDGYMDELHTLRDSYGADLVSPDRRRASLLRPGLSNDQSFREFRFQRLQCRASHLRDRLLFLRPRTGAQPGGPPRPG